MRLFTIWALYGTAVLAKEDARAKKVKNLGTKITGKLNDEPQKSKTVDLRDNKPAKKSEKSDDVELVIAPKPSKEDMMAKMMENMSQPPNSDRNFNEGFDAWALKNQFPPAVQESQMMAEWVQRNELRKKNEVKNPYIQQLRKKQNKKQLSCLTCNERSYDECYARGIVRECGEQEGACFLETRYLGYSVIHVQSGCQQKVACINNMKQNFWDLDGNGIHLEDEQMHHCKLFSGGQASNSVCRNCCFENECTQDWQPNSFDEWRILPKTPQMREMMLFDQFSNPPTHWMKAAEESRRIEYFTDLDEMNEPPEEGKKGKKGKAKETDEKTAKKGKAETDGIVNLRTTERARTTTTLRTTTKRPTTREQRTMQRQQQMRQFGPRPGMQTLGQTLGNRMGERPLGAQKLPPQRVNQVKTVRAPKPPMQHVKATEQRGKMVTTHKTPKTEQFAQTRPWTRTTQRPIVRTTFVPTTKDLSDDDFFNLLKLLDDSAKEDQKPQNDQMRFSLNVDQQGRVNQNYGKFSERKQGEVQQRFKTTRHLENHLQSKMTKPRDSIVPAGRNEKEKSEKSHNNVGLVRTTRRPVQTRPVQTRPVQTRPVQTRPGQTRPAQRRPVKMTQAAKTTPKPVVKTTAQAAVTKKGPWSHLAPWKQRQLKLARQRQLAARAKAQAAKNENAGTTAKPVIAETITKTTPSRKPVNRQPTRQLTQKPVGQKPASIKPTASKPVQLKRTSIPSGNKPLLRRTPPRQPTSPPTQPETDKKSKKEDKKERKENKVQAAQPQMMKFSQWIQPEVALESKFDEGNVMTVESNMDDGQFAAMIKTVDKQIKSGDKQLLDIDFESIIDGIQSLQSPDLRLKKADEGDSSTESPTQLSTPPSVASSTQSPTKNLISDNVFNDLITNLH